MRYLLFGAVFTYLLTACEPAQQQQKTEKLPEPSSRKVLSEIDSARFRGEIFRLDTTFRKLFEAGLFNGNVLVAKGNRLIYQASYGLADKDNNVPLRDTTAFQLASVSKVFTATAALILYQEGQLKLDEKVMTYLPGFPYPEVTVQELLTHRSGLPNYIYFCESCLKTDTGSLNNAKVLEMLKVEQPAPYFNAGGHFNYNNTNYMLLALIIEKVSGRSYADFLKEKIFLPLGMKHSYVMANGCNFSPRGYTAHWQVVENDRFDGVLGDKGIYASTYDLFLFSKALYEGRILNVTTQQLAYAPYSKERKLGNYGMGWRMRAFQTLDKEIFHNGWWHGFRTAFHRRLRDSVTIVVLSNRLNRSVYNMQKIYQALDTGHTAQLEGLDEEKEE